MRAVAALIALQIRRLGRRRWIQVVVAAGAALALVAVAVAATHEGSIREDTLRRGGAALLLLGGLVLAIGLGSGGLNLDASTGHLGMLTGAGASRPELVAGAVGARVAVLAATGLLWGLLLQGGSLVLGLGLDGPLAVHTLAVAEGLLLAMLAAAAASAVVAPGASAAFGVSIYVVAQAVVNLKAAADQMLIGTSGGLVRTLYFLFPRTVTSPMIADLQLRNAAGAAAPRVEINDNTVFVPAAGWDTVAWTLAWCILLALLCATGLRRRPIN